MKVVRSNWHLTAVVIVVLTAWLHFREDCGARDSLVLANPLPRCLQFVRYEPSNFELEWANVAPAFIGASKSVCTFLLQEADGVRFLKPLMQYLHIAVELDRSSLDLIHSRAATTQGALLDSSSSLSRLVYRTDCGDDAGREVFAYAPPLAGLLRDPRPICPLEMVRPVLHREGVLEASPVNDQFQPLILDYRYISLSASLLRQDKGARAILFDCGASSYGATGKTHNNPGLDGTKWLFDHYAAGGIVFDDIFAWEPSTSSEAFFRFAPIEIVSKTRFFPFGISSDNGFTNPLNVLKSIARPGDFVVFKLDIDSPSFEKKLVDQLLSDPMLISLVDDFFFEHHFALQDMRPWWGIPESDNIVTSIELFTVSARRRPRVQVKVFSYPW